MVTSSQGLLLTMGYAKNNFFWYYDTSCNYDIFKFPIITGTANFMETYLKLCKLAMYF